VTAPIALQLYSVREAMQQDFKQTVTRVAQMGYVGVETANFPNTTPQEAKKLFDDLGLKVCAAHLQMPLGEKQAEILATMEVLGNPSLVVPWQPPELFQSMEGMKKLANNLNEANKVAKSHGFRLGYHNHHAEMHLIDGKPALLVLSEFLDPEVFFEVDTYWAQTGGVDAADLVRTFGAKAPLLHIKDGPCVKNEPMTAVGEGVMNIEAIINASKPHAEWMIVELDACATDMIEAVAKSYSYLVGKGFAYGTQKA
jgi:sugar phosphate isomerase/epimerase